MGGKSAGKRQYVLFCFAGLVLGSGCALFDSPAPPQPPPAPAVVIIERLAPPPEPPPAPLPPVEPKEVRELRAADGHLQAAQQLMAKGEYDGSLREVQKVLSLAKDNAPADAAIFHMGLIHAHPDNAKKDNKKAIGFFTRVVKNYPESLWAEHAKIWIGVLDGLEKLKQVDLEIEERRRDRAR
jgi:tetratricopeptide (TPR) repeat protein